MQRFKLAPILLLAFLASCKGPDLPKQDSDDYREVVRSFYQAVAAVQAGEEVGARAGFERVTMLAPAEPAAWANLGLLSLRRNDFEASHEALERARSLAPDDDHVEMLFGLHFAAQGDYARAASHYERAYQLDPTNVKAAYALALELEREGSADAEARAAALLSDLSTGHPNNLALAIESARISIKREDTASLEPAVERLAAASEDWPEDVKEQFAQLNASIEQGDFRGASTNLAFVRNLLLRLPSYRADLATIQTPVEQPGDFFTSFVALPEPPPSPSPADTTLQFAAGSAVASAGTRAGVVYVDAEAAPVSWVLQGGIIRVGDSAEIPYPGQAESLPAWGRPVVSLDFDYDYQTDLVLVGDAGFRLLKGDGTGNFSDVTSSTSLPARLTSAAYVSAWVFDADLEGDLDLLLARRDGAPVVLRNNADGTFTPVDLFQDITGVRSFAWGDLDQDGDPDVAFVDATGNLAVYLNERSATYRRSDRSAENIVDVHVADLDADGRFDLLALSADGTVTVIGNESRELVRASASGAAQRLFTADLDNNGAIDLIVAYEGGSVIYLGDSTGVLVDSRVELEEQVAAVAHLDDDGRLDLLALTDDAVVSLRNEAMLPYQWQVIRPRSAMATGDQRINTFGVGGQVEVRSGLLFQKQLIDAPQIHFGLGEHGNTDVARIIWPNGDVQAEFDLEADQPILTQQRLKGSCPWVFAYDGESMAFVTDFIWRSPLGLAINGQEQAGVVLTADRVKIAGNQLVEKDGVYDVRITAELWETHFFDEVSLIAVDHPEGTEVFVDERFSIPAPSLEPQLMGPLQPVDGAWDDHGTDVGAIVAQRDATYLGTFERGRYQGIAADHYVEIQIGSDAPREGVVWLIAHGWIRPTDSSINVALGQGSHDAGRTLSLEAQADDGTWQVVGENLGFPAGKTKTLLFPIGGVLKSYPSGRLRLRTNMEIYWDSIHWARGLPSDQMRIEHLTTARADLLYRGYSEVTVADESSPEIPHYDQLKGTSRRWFDLEGYYTRFGDVRPLLATVDDRYVIMNAGDELRFEFEALPPPDSGMVRDFFLQGDGWVKDGDYNTTHSRTVRPLPLHEDTAYQGPLVPLREDPGFLRHPSDWEEFHTRYVAPDGFAAGLSNQ